MLASPASGAGRSMPWSMDPSRPAAPLPFAQQVFLDLAGRGPGELGELDLARGFEVRDAAADVVDDLLRRRPRAWLELDHGLRGLPPGLVRDGDDGGLQDRRMAHHRL